MHTAAFRKLFKVPVMSAVIFALATIAFAQNYAVPRGVPLEGPVRRAFPDYFGKQHRYPQVMEEGFYPIGWSRDGKFAYYTEPVDEACGCYFANITIQDMRTDKVLWELKYNQDDTRNDKDEMTGPDNIRKMWAKNRKLFTDKLREHGIVASSSVLLPKTFSAGGKSYTLKIATPMGKDADGEPRIAKVLLSMTSPQLGTKTVLNEDFTKEEYNFTLATGVVGAIKSPFENRVAVIVLNLNRGWEGPPHTADVQIVGSDLVSGFGKDK